MFAVTCYEVDTVVGSEGAVFPALPLPVDQDLHDFSSQRDVGGVYGHTGWGAITRFIVLSWSQKEDKQMNL